MPRPMAVVDPARCNAASCQGGVCLAAQACPNRILRQDSPYEVPYQVAMCRGCAKCAVTCPLKAIRIV